MTTAQQRNIDRITFDTYVDSGLRVAVTARNMGCSPATVRARVRRHSLALYEARRIDTKGE